MFRWVIGGLVVAVLCLAYLSPARAQGTWCYLFDFTAGQQGWEIYDVPETLGRYTMGVGFQQNLDFDGADAVEIFIEFDSTNVTDLTIYYDPALSGSNPHTILYLGNFSADDITQGGGASQAFEFDETLTQISLDADPATGDFEEWTGAIDSIEMQGTGENPFGEDNCGGGGPGGLTRPVSTTDAQPDWDMFDFDFINSLNSNYDIGYEVRAFSAAYGTSVAAVADGTVISITPFTPSKQIKRSLNSLTLTSTQRLK